MGKTLDEQPRTQVVQIEYIGEKLILPENVTLEQGIDLIKRRIAYEQETVNMQESFDVFPWDGAVALHNTLTRKYGWAQAIPTPGFFGPEPPQMIAVETGPKTKVMVPWGRMKLPNIKGYVETGFAQRDGRYVFQVSAVVKRESEKTVEELFGEIRTETETNSIYRGKAIKMRFMDNNGQRLKMPEPRFLDAEAVDETKLVYSDEVMRAVDTNLFTPVRRVKDCLRNGISLKRGVLLGGTYGTGKTLAAAVASKYAVQQGVTYLYVPRADELPDAIAFAKQYQSPACVVFCEDVDRVTSGERSVKMDDLLNIIDGIDSKSHNILVVLTTNELKSINPAMLRPGRLDAVIEITTPDAKAVEKLLRLYGDGVIAPDADLTEAGKALAGNIPAVIAEVVKRVKLAQLKYVPEGTYISHVGSEAVIDAAKTMQGQIKLLDHMINGTPKEPVPTLDAAFHAAVKTAVNGKLDHMHEDVQQIRANM